MSAGGKGSNPRPYSVPKAVFEANWDRIFGGSNSEPETEEIEGVCGECKEHCGGEMVIETGETFSGCCGATVYRS